MSVQSPLLKGFLRFQPSHSFRQPATPNDRFCRKSESISESTPPDSKAESLSPTGIEHHSISGSSPVYPAIRITRLIYSTEKIYPIPIIWSQDITQVILAGNPHPRVFRQPISAYWRNNIAWFGEEMFLVFYELS